jgi:hypothetical protein
MRSFAQVPIDRLLTIWWQRIDVSSKRAFFAVIAVSVLAFGFEMTNLTLHHDDVLQIFIQDTILGHFLGRFSLGPLYYYTQSSYFMPFLQMAEGLTLMGLYGVLVARFWGLRRTLDIALVAAILCVFPYLANMYQYNTAMATYPLAYLLAAAGVVLASRATVRGTVIGALLVMAALSIYQAVIANAATLFLIFLIVRALFKERDEPFVSNAMIGAVVAVVIAAVLGSALYLVGVSFVDVKYDAEQAADKAFSLSGLDIVRGAKDVLEGTRRFLLWPENYFPGYLKTLQLAFVAMAGLACLWLPRRLWQKAAAVVVLALTALAPRLLQLIHPEGNYHSLTLTAYALLVAGAVAIVLRAAPVLLRNASAILAAFMIAAYVIQCNWISTVNDLNTMAHFATMTQLLAKIRSLPDGQWDGIKIAVVGAYDMPTEYPYKPATGVASKFIDAEHMNHLARLLRDKATFVEADRTMPKVLEYAATHPPWPNPASVGIVDGMGVIVLSRPAR